MVDRLRSLFRAGVSFQGRKGFARKGKISRKIAVHRLDIFRRRVYNVRKYVIVCPGTSVAPLVGTVFSSAPGPLSGVKNEVK